MQRLSDSKQFYLLPRLLVRTMAISSKRWLVHRTIMQVLIQTEMRKLLVYINAIGPSLIPVDLSLPLAYLEEQCSVVSLLFVALVDPPGNTLTTSFQLSSSTINTSSSISSTRHDTRPGRVTISTAFSPSADHTRPLAYSRDGFARATAFNAFYRIAHGDVSHDNGSSVIFRHHAL